MPTPLARCAFSRSCCGTSTVILRAVSIMVYCTIFDTSIEYGIFRRRRRTRHRTPDAPRVSYAERYSGFLAAGFLAAALGFQKSGAAAATSCGGLVNSTVRMDSEAVLRNFS